MNTQERQARTEQYKKYIAHMTTDRIERQSFLISMSEDTANNRLFQELLTAEYWMRTKSKRKYQERD